MKTQDELREEIARYQDATAALEDVLTEARKVSEQLLSVGQMQAVLLVLLKRQRGLKLAELNDIAFADRKMRDLDLPIRSQLRNVVRQKYEEAGQSPPDFEIAGMGSSLRWSD